MSYALVPVTRFHPAVRLPRGARIVPPRWAAAGLGGMGTGLSDRFFWSPESWYYLYAWAPGAGWDMGRWLQGSDLCDAAKTARWGSSHGATGLAKWFAIWSDTTQKFVLFDQVGTFTEIAMCNYDAWMYARQHQPGEVVS
jgi:hypothetical protein